MHIKLFRLGKVAAADDSFKILVALVDDDNTSAIGYATTDSFCSASVACVLHLILPKSPSLHGGKTSHSLSTSANRRPSTKQSQLFGIGSTQHPYSPNASFDAKSSKWQSPRICVTSAQGIASKYRHDAATNFRAGTTPTANDVAMTAKDRFMTIDTCAAGNRSADRHQIQEDTKKVCAHSRAWVVLTLPLVFALPWSEPAIGCCLFSFKGRRLAGARIAMTTGETGLQKFSTPAGASTQPQPPQLSLAQLYQYLYLH